MTNHCSFPGVCQKCSGVSVTAQWVLLGCVSPHMLSSWCLLPERIVIQGNLFTYLCLALKQGALKHVKSEEADYGSIFEVHFPSGFVDMSPERILPSVCISLMACMLECNLVSFGKQRHTLVTFMLNPEGRRQ